MQRKHKVVYSVIYGICLYDDIGRRWKMKVLLLCCCWDRSHVCTHAKHTRNACAALSAEQCRRQLGKRKLLARIFDLYIALPSDSAKHANDLYELRIAFHYIQRNYHQCMHGVQFPSGGGMTRTSANKQTKIGKLSWPSPSIATFRTEKKNTSAPAKAKKFLNIFHKSARAAQ